MKNISYNIICEDVAHLTFIDEFLKHVCIGNAAISFTLNLNCFEPWSFKNKSSVLKTYATVGTRNFRIHNIDLLFVITDFDDWKISDFSDHHNKLKADLPNDLKDKVLILLPVKAIEYWLWYIKNKAANPIATKNHPIENKTRREMKVEIYDGIRPSKEISRDRVIEVMETFDPKWLVSRSDSFKHFYANFEKFLKQP